MKFWLMKTEPDVFSFDDLLKSPKKTTSWEGVRNYQARNFMRDQFKKGDRVLVYHSNTEEPAVVGIAEVVKEGYPDSHALDPKSRYYDSDLKGKKENPWVMIDIRGIEKFKKPVTRDLMKSEKKLKNAMVLQKGSRLSVQPVTEEEYQAILSLGDNS